MGKKIWLRRRLIESSLMAQELQGIGKLMVVDDGSMDSNRRPSSIQ